MKLRLRFRKGHSVRWLSHLDLSRAWVRAFIRAGLPLAYSEGFTPHPKLAFGPALPVGVAGEAEYMDMALTDKVEPGGMIERLNAMVPAGMEAGAAIVLPDDRRVPSLAGSITVADYSLVVEGGVRAEIEQALTGYGIIAKQGEDDQITPALLSLEEDGGQTSVFVRVPITFKPAAICAPETGDSRFIGARIDRRALWVLVNGRLVDPLDAVGRS